MNRENYDPNQPVCDNQNDFNQAFLNAVKNMKSMSKSSKIVYTVLWLFFLLWAILLALRVPEGQERIQHLVFAFLFSPVYILSYYLGHMSMGMKAGFGCGCSS